jgi:LytTr DNA-binding domain
LTRRRDCRNFTARPVPSRFEDSLVTQPHTELSADIARRIRFIQLQFFAVLLFLIALSNASSVLADHVRAGNPLPVWEPLVWELSSTTVLWLLVPMVARALARFSLSQGDWRRHLPVHLLATVPFSLLHTLGMVLIRQAAYALAGSHYRFGPWWTNWLYEYRKDALTYAVIVSALLAFRVYGLWLDSRAPHETRMTPTPAPTPPSSDPHLNPIAPLTRLVVSKRNREFILDAGDIDRIDSDGNYVIVHAGGESYRLRDSLEGLSRRLGEQRFARVHRAHVVNIDRIREIQPWDHGDYRILLQDGSFLNFSRRYRSRLGHLFR